MQNARIFRTLKKKKFRKFGSGAGGATPGGGASAVGTRGEGVTRTRDAMQCSPANIASLTKLAKYIDEILSPFFSVFSAPLLKN